MSYVVNSILIRANNHFTQLYKVHFVSEHFDFNFKITWVIAIFFEWQ